MKKRRGVTLVELIVVIGIDTVLLGLAVTLIGMLIAAGQQCRRDVERGMALAMLSDDLRRDARRATLENLVIREDSIELRMSDNSTVVYDSSGQYVTRTARHEGAIIASENYRLPPGWRVSFQLAPSPPGELLQCVVETSAGNGEWKAVRQFDAVLGADLRQGAAFK